MTNMRKLAIAKASRDAVPDGAGLAEAIAFIQNTRGMAEAVKRAEQWAREAVQVVRTGAEPNPWKNADDEAIAGEILRQLEAKTNQR